MSWWVFSPQILSLKSPIQMDALAGISTDCRVVQFDSLLSDEDFSLLARVLEDHPQITLRTFGNTDGSITNLDFLSHFPRLRRFRADALYELADISGLMHLPRDLEHLGLGQTRKRFSLDVLRRFSALKRLWLERHTKDIEVLAELAELEDLTLRSITLPDLSLLTSMRHLRALDLKLGGTKELALLPGVGRLEYVELWMVRGLADLSPLSAVPTLRYLFLQSLANVSSLPILDAATNLIGVHLETMKGVAGLAPLASAPALEQLEVRDLPRLQPSDLQVLVGHPTLREATIVLGRRSEDAVRAILPLPRVVKSGRSWRQAVSDTIV